MSLECIANPAGPIAPTGRKSDEQQQCDNGPQGKRVLGSHFGYGRAGAQILQRIRHAAAMFAPKGTGKRIIAASQMGKIILLRRHRAMLQLRNPLNTGVDFRCAW